MLLRVQTFGALSKDVVPGVWLWPAERQWQQELAWQQQEQDGCALCYLARWVPAIVATVAPVVVLLAGVTTVGGQVCACV
jgi:hypothetical protein